MDYPNDKLGYDWYKLLKDYLPLAIQKNGLSKYFGKSSVFLHGSTTTGMSDEFTDLDLWVFLDDAFYSEYMSSGQPTFVDIELENRWGHLNIESRSIFVQRLRDCDFPLMYELKNSFLIFDNANLETTYKKSLEPLSTEIRTAHFLYNYVEARNWQKSCENIIRRQDVISLLINIPKVISHALRASILLEGHPYPYDKWLPKVAQRTKYGALINLYAREVLANLNSPPEIKPVQLESDKVFVALEKIKDALKEGAGEYGIVSPYLKQWYMYIDIAANDVKKLKWD